jgi:tripeptidyl-peptidase-2
VRKAKDSAHPQGWPVTYVVPPKPAPPPPPPASSASTPATAKNGGKGEEEEESEASKLCKAVLELKVKTLGALSAAGTPEKDKAWEELCAVLEGKEGGGGDAAPANHLPLMLAKLAHADREATRKKSSSSCSSSSSGGESGDGKEEGGDGNGGDGGRASLEAVVSAADGVLSCLDASSLSSALGLKVVDPNDTAEAKARKGLEEKKAALIDALARKARALLDLSTIDEEGGAGGEEEEKDSAAASAASADSSATTATTTTTTVALFEETLKQLKQWEDVFAPAKAPALGRLAVASLLSSSSSSAKKKMSGEGVGGALLKYLDKARAELAVEDVQGGGGVRV